MGSKAVKKTKFTRKGLRALSKSMKLNWANPVWAKRQGKLISKGLQRHYA